MKYSYFTVILLSISHLCWGQSNGYNYERPIIPGGGSGTSIRPGGFPATGSGGFPGTATTPAFGGFPSGPSTAPGRPGFGTSVGPTGGFPGRPGGIQSDTTGGGVFTGPSTGFPSGPGVGGSRPGSGIRPTPTFPGSIGQRPGTAPGSQFGTIGGTSTGNDDGSYPDGDYSAIPGTPGVDYPIFADIPQTSFDCNQQQFPGYYADVETQCQVFHICALNKTFDFICPNGTIFSQETLVCVWWNQFDCGSAPALYPNNAFIYDYSQTGQQSQQGGAPGSGFVGQPGSTGTGGGIGGVTQRPGTGGTIFPGQRPGGRPPTGPSGGYPGGPTGPSGFPGTGVGSTGGFPGAGTGPSGGFPGAGSGSTGAFPSGPGATPPTPGGFPGAGVGSTAGGFPSGPSTASGANVTPPTGFGSTVRPGAGGFPGIQGDTGFIGGGSPVTPQTPNREYLPPRRT